MTKAESVFEKLSAAKGKKAAVIAGTVVPGVVGAKLGKGVKGKLAGAAAGLFLGGGVSTLADAMN